MAYSATEWMVVLVNFALDKASLRVMCPSRSGFEGCSVGISPLVVVRASARGSGWQGAGGRTSADVAMSCRPGLPQRRWLCCSAQDGGVAAGMAAQGRWRRRRRASLVRRHSVVPCGRETSVCTLFEGSAAFFPGCGTRTVREWAAQCHGADTGLTAQCRTVVGMASPGGLTKQRRDMIPRRCQWVGVAEICLWPGRPCCVRAFNDLVGGVGTGAANLREPQARRRPARGRA
jgi:hypothetical protein